MTTTSVDTVEIAERLTCCADALDEADQRAQLALFRLLAGGEPVEPTRLAAQTGTETSDVLERLGRWHGVHTDADARIVAFQGLSPVETPHRLQVAGRTLYAWCAWDTLFLPELIRRPAQVESACPTTGEAISLRVGPEGPTHVSPPRAALSFLLPDSTFGDDTIESFCAFIHYFASAEAVSEWTKQHPATFVISIEHGFDIGRRTTAAQFGDALSGSRT